ncbi:unnamed protein product [Brachionus calyciflorus]|uniref:Uncharacterized protein n=1 Tax=Brachionus calyciflorus TaxID=104777 RepID=A0A813RAV6_9BILA|nr:unnamed protein product [Brachionus calyciflorus]
MVFYLLKSWSILLILLSIFLLNKKIKCNRFVNDVSSQNDFDDENYEIGIQRREFNIKPEATKYPLDDEFRTRLEQFFSPDIIQKMTDLIAKNQKIKESKTHQNPLIQKFIPIRPEMQRPTSFLDQSMTDTNKNSFIEALKTKHQKTTVKPSNQATASSESNTNILMHLYHRFG